MHKQNPMHKHLILQMLKHLLDTLQVRQPAKCDCKCTESYIANAKHLGFDCKCTESLYCECSNICKKYCKCTNSCTLLQMHKSIYCKCTTTCDAQSKCTNTCPRYCKCTITLHCKCTTTCKTTCECTTTISLYCKRNKVHILQTHKLLSHIKHKEGHQLQDGMEYCHNSVQLQSVLSI